MGKRQDVNQRNSVTPQNNARRGNSIYEHPFLLWRMRHLEAFKQSFQKFRQSPVAMGLTISVIGIALALPALLMILLHNLESLGAGWKNNTQISLFVKMNESYTNILSLVQALQADSDIAKVTYISPQEGLAAFEQASGMTHLAEALPANPLPAVIQINPAVKMQSPLAVQSLVRELEQLPETDFVQLDMAWVVRLFAILNTVREMVLGIGILLSIGVILIIGNTIRLATENNRDDIDVMQLIGAAHAYVRRPFLYTGMFYGLFGGILAWVFVELILLFLNRPIIELASAYQSHFKLIGLGFSGTMALWVLSGFLGLMGSWLVLSYYLRTRKII